MKYTKKILTARVSDGGELARMHNDIEALYDRRNNNFPSTEFHTTSGYLVCIVTYMEEIAP